MAVPAKQNVFGLYFDLAPPWASVVEIRRIANLDRLGWSWIFSGTRSRA